MEGNAGSFFFFSQAQSAKSAPGLIRIHCSVSQRNSSQKYGLFTCEALRLDQKRIVDCVND